MSKSPNEAPCRVFDMNATLGVRKHSVGGVLYPLSASGEGTPVPLAHALKFLRDPAFVVLDDRGNRMQMQSEAPERPDIKLMPHQTIANLDELSNLALVARALKLPGSDGLNKNSGKRKIIDFIMTGGIENAIETVPFNPETEVLIEDDDEDDGGDGNIEVADRALEGESLPVI